MSIEGLNYVLEKEEIIATQHAEDLVQQARLVDETYQRHVRTYIPLGRDADTGSDGYNVEKFERKVIRDIKNKAALRGYLTAEYGYGKTSTALYLWHRARKENIIAVPPFQLNRLQDLITATFGWVRYELERTRPGLVMDAQSIYDSLINRSVEDMADESGADITALRDWVEKGKLILELTAADYLYFFEKMNALGQEAGFEGLLVLADEVQQYIEPEIKSGIKDPISPLFNVVQQILTRKGHLPFGLILVLPPKEISLLRDQRGDLVHRVLQVSLDLSSVYDRDFPHRLWRRLADEFEFEDHRDRIVTDETLDALGQISGRKDLSDGPRTVVNTFRRMTRRYLELGHPPDDPYTPRHLIDDFLNGAIEFDGPKQIQEVTSRALEHTLVRGRHERETAVKWAAAFPNEGIPRRLQEQLDLIDAFDELMQSAQGDLVIAVGDVDNPGITLRGLDRVDIATDWLSTTIREFWRNYYETIDLTRQRAIAAFFDLLRAHVFPESHWKLKEQLPPDRMTQNTGLVLEGSFPSIEVDFPERKIHVRVLWEDESIKDAGALGEVVVQFRLRRHLKKTEEQRRQLAHPVELAYEGRRIEIDLNLMYRDDKGVSPQLERQIGRIVSPYKLTPLLMLNLHEVFEEKREKNVIPKAEDQQIQYGLQPDLMENVFRNLFNAQVGAPLDASGKRIVELALNNMLEVLYSDYTPLMIVSNWSSSLKKYSNALQHLETAHERQGQIVCEGNKEDVANLFTLSNTGLDSFIANFPTLLVVEQDFPTRREAQEGKKGAVRFRLHPLERKILEWLRDSDETERITVGGETHTVHRLLRHKVYKQAESMGYREQEIDAIIELMKDRNLIELDSRRGFLREAVTQAPSVDELENEIQAWRTDLSTLRGVFSDAQLAQWWQDSGKYQQIITTQLRRHADDEKLIRLRRTVRARQEDLQNFAKDRHAALRKEASRMLNSIPTPDRRQSNRLRKPIQGSVAYVEQVDDLRARLERQFTTLANDMEKLEVTTSLIHAALRQEELSPEKLSEFAEKLENIRTKGARLREQRKEFDERFEHFAKWVELVDKGSTLRQKMNELGSAVSEMESAFEAITREIRGHISSEKLDALPDAATYELQLQEISETVRRVEAEATKRFNTLQQRYRDALTQTLRYPRDRLWSLEEYNPRVPESSYQKLRNHVREALQRTIDQLEKVSSQQEDDLRSALTSPAFQTLSQDEQSSLEERIQSSTTELEDLKNALQGAKKGIDGGKTIDDFPEGEEKGAFRELLATLRDIHDRIVRLRDTVDQITDRLRSLKLSSEEQQLHEALPKQRQVDLGSVKQAASRLNDMQFWRALQGLYDKRRIRIYIEPIRREE